MESFFEFIFANIFLVVFVIVSLLGFLNRKGQKQQNKRNEADDPPRKSTLDETFRRFQEMVETFEDDVEKTFVPKQEQNEKTKQAEQKFETDVKETNVAMNSQTLVQDEKQQQMERLRQQYASTSFDEDKESYGAQRERIRPLTKQIEQNNEQPSLHLEGKLSRDGLIESIIMAEVLGPPRARKRYEGYMTYRK